MLGRRGRRKFGIVAAHTAHPYYGPLRLRPFPQSLQLGCTMLRGLRKATDSWLGKTILGAVVGVLILAFGIWGIGDVLRGGGRSNVATVGNTEISAEQFRQAYTDQLQQLQRQLGRPIP